MVNYLHNFHPNEPGCVYIVFLSFNTSARLCSRRTEKKIDNGLCTFHYLFFFLNCVIELFYILRIECFFL